METLAAETGIDEVNRKLDLILDEVDALKRQREAFSELKDDLSLIARDMFNSVVIELDDVEGGDAGVDERHVVVDDPVAPAPREGLVPQGLGGRVNLIDEPGSGGEGVLLDGQVEDAVPADGPADTNTRVRLAVSPHEIHENDLVRCRCLGHVLHEILRAQHEPVVRGRLGGLA